MKAKYVWAALYGMIFGSIIAVIVSLGFGLNAYTDTGMSFLAGRLADRELSCDGINWTELRLFLPMWEAILSILCPLGAAFGAIATAVYVKMRTGAKKQPLLDIFLGVPFLHILCAVFLCNFVPKMNAQFLPERWRESPAARDSMMPDLFAHHKIVGESVDKINQFLGAPDGLDPFEVNTPNAGSVSYRTMKGVWRLTYDKHARLIKDQKVHRISDFDKLTFKETPKPRLLDFWEDELPGYQSGRFPQYAGYVEVDGKRIPTPAQVRKDTLRGFPKNRAGKADLRSLNLGLLYGDEVISLPDGNVFACGGMSNDNHSVFDSTWIIDPKTKKAKPGPKMSIQRRDVTLVRLKDGRILIAGGIREDYESVTTCEIYDPKTRQLSSAGDLVVPRSDAGVAVLNNGNVIFVSGRTASNYVDGTANNTTSVEVFRPNPAQGVPAHQLIGATEKDGTELLVVPFENDNAIVLTPLGHASFDARAFKNPIN